jgi:cell division transport system permease protein
LNSSRNNPTYFYSIFATTLVLIVLGIVVFIAFEAKKTSSAIRENLTVEVVLNNEIKPEEIKELQTIFQKKDYVKSSTYISKEQAAESMKKELGENYLDILGYNPLYPSFRIFLKEDFANERSFEKIKKEVAALPHISQINFQNTVLGFLDKTIGNLTFIGLIMGGILLAFAISLIFNTIKLVIYSRRATIRSMQLFGATRWFIIQPFLLRSLVNGLLSGVFAGLVLAGFMYYLDYQMPDIGLQSDLTIFATLLGLLILFGILISFLSTVIALTRYLNYKLED